MRAARGSGHSSRHPLMDTMIFSILLFPSSKTAQTTSLRKTIGEWEGSSNPFSTGVEKTNFPLSTGVEKTNFPFSTGVEKTNFPLPVFRPSPANRPTSFGRRASAQPGAGTKEAIWCFAQRESSLSRFGETKASSAGRAFSQVVWNRLSSPSVFSVPDAGGTGTVSGTPSSIISGIPSNPIPPSVSRKHPGIWGGTSSSPIVGAGWEKTTAHSSRRAPAPVRTAGPVALRPPNRAKEPPAPVRTAGPLPCGTRR